MSEESTPENKPEGAPKKAASSRPSRPPRSRSAAPKKNDAPPPSRGFQQPPRAPRPAARPVAKPAAKPAENSRPAPRPAPSATVPLPLERGMNPDPAAVKATPESIAADRKAFLEREPEKPPRGAENLTVLGKKGAIYSDQYTPVILETFDNRHMEYDYWVKFNCPEFTSLCPITGQPDFATIYISYIPDRRMVESKSLKLYLFGFRNHGAFHEDCINIIMKDLIRLMSPRYIEVWGKFLPRGGISIDPYCNYGRPGTRFEEFARQRLMMHDLNLERVDNR